MIAVVALVTVVSSAMVRLAPGYLSDAREMDAKYASAARQELASEARRNGSIAQVLLNEMTDWTRGTLGLSREYEVPVAELIRPRLAVTGSLTLRAIALAWVLALCGAMAASLAWRIRVAAQMPVAVLLAVPTAAMATTCLLMDTGGPIAVLTLVIAVRDFKFVERILRRAWREPHLLQARAQGITTARMVWAHILPGIAPQLLTLASLSIVTALGAIVPVEVIFNVPGLGNLAWDAAQNRDIPVLVAVTILIAVGVTLSEVFSNRGPELVSV
jgi:peptide/nickel transport system permease protein